MARLILGIESTAHTFSFGYVDIDGNLFSSKSCLFKPETGGIHPREAADHHTINAANLINELNDDESFNDEINLKDGSIYSLVFSGQDLAGNIATDDTGALTYEQQESTVQAFDPNKIDPSIIL